MCDEVSNSKRKMLQIFLQWNAKMTENDDRINKT